LPDDETIILPTITADRILTIPNPISYSLKRITLINSNSSSFLWNTSREIYTPNGDVLLNIPSGAIEIESDGTKWNVVSNYSEDDIDIIYNDSSGSLAVSLSEGKNISKVYFTNQTGPVTINGVNNPTSNRSFIVVNVTDYNLT